MPARDVSSTHFPDLLSGYHPWCLKPAGSPGWPIGGDGCPENICFHRFLSCEDSAHALLSEYNQPAEFGRTVYGNGGKRRQGVWLSALICPKAQREKQVHFFSWWIYRNYHIIACSLTSRYVGINVVLTRHKKYTTNKRKAARTALEEPLGAWSVSWVLTMWVWDLPKGNWNGSVTWQPAQMQYWPFQSWFKLSLRRQHDRDLTLNISSILDRRCSFFRKKKKKLKIKKIRIPIDSFSKTITMVLTMPYVFLPKWCTAQIVAS